MLDLSGLGKATGAVLNRVSFEELEKAMVATAERLPNAKDNRAQ